MGISWYNRTIADAHLNRVHGLKAAGGYVLRLSVEFDIQNWGKNEPIPVVAFGPARVSMERPDNIWLGFAYPEVFLPFTVTQQSGKSVLLFDLPISQAAMETVERIRNGGDVALVMHLQAEIRIGSEVQHGWAQPTATFNVSQWATALEQAGYGRILLFEVPIPTEMSVIGSPLGELNSARQLLASGHYAEVVAKCRLVLEGLTQELADDAELKSARSTQPKERTRPQRELLMRQSAIEFSHLAHHLNRESLIETFDRNSAQMMLGITAALVSSAMARKTIPRPHP